MTKGRLNSHAIYEALFDDEAFAALPAILAQSARARSAIIQWRHVDQAHEVLAYSHFTPDFMALYATTYGAIDPWVIAAAGRARNNEVIRLDRYVPAAMFEASRINRELVKGQGDDTFHCAGVMFRTAWGEGLLGVHRGRFAPGFEEEDLAPLAGCALHLRRMLQVRGELAAHRRGAQLARETLDSLAIGAVVARRDGGIVEANLAAESVLDRSDGLGVSRGRLACTDHTSRLKLDAALAAATVAINPTASTIAIDRGQGAPAYLVSVTPLSGSEGRALALLVFRDPEIVETSLEPRLRSLFNLTRIEASIAVDVANGLAPPQIARNRGVKPNTIKSQLASLAAKMGCGRQSEIAARVARLPPVGLGRVRVSSRIPDPVCALPTLR